MGAIVQEIRKSNNEKYNNKEHMNHTGCRSQGGKYYRGRDDYVDLLDMGKETGYIETWTYLGIVVVRY